jgi:hypothetical protein
MRDHRRRRRPTETAIAPPFAAAAFAALEGAPLAIQIIAAIIAAIMPFLVSTVVDQRRSSS